MTNPAIDPATDKRRALLEVAARLLAEDGPHGLSLRRIAAEAGGSTQLVYTLFGGKQGLADALYAEGFGRLAVRMQAATAHGPVVGDPERMMALGWAYRQFAIDEPAFFSVMFGRAIPGFTPARETRDHGRESSLGQVIIVAQECLDAGTLAAPSALELARSCWVMVHGMASLETAGLLPDADPAFVERMMRIPLDAHRA